MFTAKAPEIAAPIRRRGQLKIVKQKIEIKVISIYLFRAFLQGFTSQTHYKNAATACVVQPCPQLKPA